jgi:hypothetical protein
MREGAGFEWSGGGFVVETDLERAVVALDNF